MRKMMVLALGLAFAMGTVTAFAQNAPAKKSAKKKSGKKGGKKAPKKTSTGTL
jgi:hypothetical protein